MPGSAVPERHLARGKGWVFHKASAIIRDWCYRLRHDFGMAKSGRRSIDPDLSGGRAQMLNARVPAALFDQLTSESERRGISRSGAVREALDIWLSTPVENIEEPAPA